MKWSDIDLREIAIQRTNSFALTMELKKEIAMSFLESAIESLDPAPDEEKGIDRALNVLFERTDAQKMSQMFSKTQRPGCVQYLRDGVPFTAGRS